MFGNCQTVMQPEARPLFCPGSRTPSFRSSAACVKRISGSARRTLTGKSARQMNMPTHTPKRVNELSHLHWKPASKDNAARC